MNRGTLEGTAEEKSLVAILNENLQHPIWSTLGIDSSKHLYAIHVVTNVHSPYFGRTIKPKADVYIAEGNRVETSFLESRGFVIDEDDLVALGLTPVSNSGISVKLQDSTRFQILKASPDSFAQIFGSHELGAGASIYCKRPEEFPKNDALLQGWGTNKSDFVSFFLDKVDGVSDLFVESTSIEKKLEIAAKLKKYASRQIAEMIKASAVISDYVFTGKGLYPEPYPATWIYEAGEFRKNGPMDFAVTTGSGRSRGDYTIVIKPR
jgi:hypothetical protein